MIRTMIKELDDLELALETAQGEEREALEQQRQALAVRFTQLTPEQKVLMARYPRRPKIDHYIAALFIQLHQPVKGGSGFRPAL